MLGEMHVYITICTRGQASQPALGSELRACIQDMYDERKLALSSNSSSRGNIPQRVVSGEW